MGLTNDTVIKVTGVGGGGSNAVEHIVRERIEGAEFFAVDTDTQTLRKTTVGQTVQTGSGITKGLGAGMNPEVGRNAADGGRETLHAALDDADMVFIAAGVDGGTGTGVAPVVVGVAKDLGILTIVVATKPSNFEDGKHMAFAEQGVTKLSKHVNSLITIPNDKLLKALGRGISLLDAFGAVNDVLKGTAQGVAELITRPDLMNVDFTDVRTVMSGMGYAMMDSGTASGEDHVEEAAEIAISSLLLEDIDLPDARGILVDITAGSSLRLDEFETAGNITRIFASDNAAVAVGTSLDSSMNDELRVTVVATGIGMDKHPETTLVTSKQVQQPVTGCYQQRGMSPLVQEQKSTTRMANDNTPQTAKELDYLDIPAFLCEQVD